MDYILHLFILISIFSILAISLNLVVGYTGLLSITHAAFFGLGAYSTAILLTRFEVNFFVSLLVSIVITIFFSLCIGFVLSRFKEDIYAIASFGFNVIIFSVFLNWQAMTRGPLGIPGISRPSLFGVDTSLNSFVVMVIVLVTALYFLSSRLARSPFGRVLQAIREDELAVKILRYNAAMYKLTIFVMAAIMASLAGSFYASYITFIDPSSFTVSESIFILAMIILGGLASVKGSVLGAAALILLPEALRFVGFSSDIAAQMRQLVYGALLIVLMMHRPQGLLGRYKL